MTKTEKTVNISKETFNFLKDNEDTAKQVLKSFEKRRKKNLPVALEHSSEVSQSAILVIDLTGKKPIVVEGEKAIRDMPVVSRKKVIDSPEKAMLDDDLDADQEQEVEEVEEEAGEYQEEEEEEAVDEEGEFEAEEVEEAEAEKEVEEAEEVEATRHLPEKLQDVVDDLYVALTGPNFNRTITQTPAVELSEFTFVPLSSTSSETSLLTSFKDAGLLAEKTRTSAKSSYSLRCFNTYLARSALIDKLLVLNPSKTKAQVIYSLKELFILSQANNDGIEVEWKKLKQCSVRGKALYDLMEELNLGTYLFMANLKWSTLYELSLADRELIVTFIKANPENHRKLIQACAVPQEKESPLPRDQFDDSELDAMLDDPAILAQLDQQQQESVNPVVRKKTLGPGRRG